jgi:deoxyribonuclease V
MIAAFDVHYPGDGRASVAAVLFRDYKDPEPALEHVRMTEVVSDYIPGRFYLRELPCIISLFELFDEAPDEMVVDGYVTLGGRPGLGQHLFDAFDRKISVIGAAKSKYRDASGIEVFRGRSTRPLYVTSAGMKPTEAAQRIASMHGAFRIPTLLRRVDLLARNHTRTIIT